MRYTDYVISMLWTFLLQTFWDLTFGDIIPNCCVMIGWYNWIQVQMLYIFKRFVTVEPGSTM